MAVPPEYQELIQSTLQSIIKHHSSRNVMFVNTTNPASFHRLVETLSVKGLTTAQRQNNLNKRYTYNRQEGRWQFQDMLSKHDPKFLLNHDEIVPQMLRVYWDRLEKGIKWNTETVRKESPWYIYRNLWKIFHDTAKELHLHTIPLTNDQKEAIAHSCAQQHRQPVQHYVTPSRKSNPQSQAQNIRPKQANRSPNHALSSPPVTVASAPRPCPVSSPRMAVRRLPSPSPISSPSFAVAAPPPSPFSSPLLPLITDLPPSTPLDAFTPSTDWENRPPFDNLVAPPLSPPYEQAHDIERTYSPMIFQTPPPLPYFDPNQFHHGLTPFDDQWPFGGLSSSPLRQKNLSLRQSPFHSKLRSPALARQVSFRSNVLRDPINDPSQSVPSIGIARPKPGRSPATLNQEHISEPRSPQGPQLAYDTVSDLSPNDDSDDSPTKTVSQAPAPASRKRKQQSSSKKAAPAAKRIKTTSTGKKSGIKGRVKRHAPPRAAAEDHHPHREKVRAGLSNFVSICQYLDGPDANLRTQSPEKPKSRQPPSSNTYDSDDDSSSVDSDDDDGDLRYSPVFDRRRYEPIALQAQRHRQAQRLLPHHYVSVQPWLRQ